MLDLDDLTMQMARNAQTIHQLTLGFSTEAGRWKPDAETWSVVEVLNHLYYEERMDFRLLLAQGFQIEPLRADFIGEYPFSGEFPYDAADAAQAVRAFLDERAQSLIWLRGLGDVDWNAQCQIRRGPISTGDVMAAWVAHDLLHMRQLVELHYAHLTRQLQPNSVIYAGDW